MDILLSLVTPRLLAAGEYHLREFLLNLNPESSWRAGRKWQGAEPTFQELIASRCLAFLSLVDVQKGGVTLLPLDKPDPLLLGIAFRGHKENGAPAISIH